MVEATSKRLALFSHAGCPRQGDRLVNPSNAANARRPELVYHPCRSRRYLPARFLPRFPSKTVASVDCTASMFGDARS